MRRLLKWASIVLVALVIAAAWSDRDARAQLHVARSAQADPSDAVVSKVAFVPRLGSDVTHGPGRLCHCRAGTAGRPFDCACDPRDPAREALMPLEGATVQNLGDRPTRFMIVTFLPGFADGSCEECGYSFSACSPDVAPGMTWTFSPYARAGGTAPSPGATSAVLYSLSGEPAADAGPGWQAWLAERGLDPDSRLADLACRFVATGDYVTEAPEPGTPGTEPCASYGDFHGAFVSSDGRLPGTNLPIAPVRGQPMAGVVSSATTAGSPDHLVIDRTEAVGWSEAAPMATGGVQVYVAPGGSGRTEDGTNSVLSVQNAGTTCATARVQPHRARFGAFGEAVGLTVPPGRRVEIDVGSAWPELRQGAALVVTSEGLLAATLTNQSVATSSTFVARRERPVPVRWLVPRAYQEERSLPLLASWPLRSQDLARADGWQTNLAIFNPAEVREMATFRFQAAGEPPRPLLDYPVDAGSQVVLQPGFGLGPPGGPGWAEITSSEAPLTVSSESLRAARGAPGLVIESWGASAYPVEGSGRVIGLPTLGGPAIGAVAAGEVVSPTERLTDTLLTRLSIQNPLTTTARVAVDSYGQGCGYVGSIERAIDPRQAVIIDAAELAGTAFGADAALVRVLDGDVAVLVETSRATWLAAAPSAVPLDLTSAYLGAATDGPIEAPSPLTATLVARPVEVELRMGDTVIDAQLTLEDAAGTGRCLSVRAESSASWLTILESRIEVPGVVRLRVLPDVPGGGVLRATITLTAEQPNVDGSPATVFVTVTRERGPVIFLPITANVGGPG